MDNQTLSNENIENSGGSVSSYRETPLDSSSLYFYSKKNFTTENDEDCKGEEKEKNIGRVSLLTAYEKIFGHEFGNVPTTYYEAMTLNKYPEIIRLMNGQKVWHTAGLVSEFEDTIDISKYKVDRITKILLRRGMIRAQTWNGDSKFFYGMIIYRTLDSTDYDLSNYLHYYENIDEVKKNHESKFSKKKSAEEVVKHNEQVKKLSLKTAKLKLCELKDVDHTKLLQSDQLSKHLEYFYCNWESGN